MSTKANDQDFIDALERQILTADLRTPPRRPWVVEERREIIQLAKDCLGVREQWIPRIEPELELATSHGGISIKTLSGQSWDRCFCAAHLYAPQRPPPGRLPLVLLCCGHAVGGKQAEGYRRMAWRLAGQGCAVLVPDNIGQGERVAMGHRDVVAPFRGGISLQGMIVMETIGWLRWALADGGFDQKRIAAIGNSGGGTLSLFLGAFCQDDLAALSSSGYPSAFHFIAAKEKKHCHCNILPGIVGTLQMWQLYGCFAPKPLFIFQGQTDHLFPEDVFDTVSRRTAHAYDLAGSASAFSSEIFPGGHPWDDERRTALAEFLGHCLGFDASPEATAFPEEIPENCYASWPTEALSTDELAARITRVPTVKNDELWEVYRPGLGNLGNTQFRRVGCRQLAAQMQAFLCPECRLPNQPFDAKAYSRVRTATLNALGNEHR